MPSSSLGGRGCAGNPRRSTHRGTWTIPLLDNVTRYSENEEEGGPLSSLLLFIPFPFPTRPCASPPCEGFVAVKPALPSPSRGPRRAGMFHTTLWPSWFYGPYLLVKIRLCTRHRVGYWRSDSEPTKHFFFPEGIFHLVRWEISKKKKQCILHHKECGFHSESNESHWKGCKQLDPDMWHTISRTYVLKTHNVRSLACAYTQKIITTV